jgi:hypothetical protein
MANQNQTNFLIKPEPERKSTITSDIIEKDESTDAKKIDEIVQEKTAVVNKKKPKLKSFEPTTSGDKQNEGTGVVDTKPKEEEKSIVQIVEEVKKSNLFDLDNKKVEQTMEDPKLKPSFDLKQNQVKDEQVKKSDTKKKNLFDFNDNDDDSTQVMPIKKEVKKDIKQEKIKFLFDDE